MSARFTARETTFQVAIVGPRGPQIRLVTPLEAKSMERAGILVPSVPKAGARSRLSAATAQMGRMREPETERIMGGSENGDLSQAAKQVRTADKRNGVPELRGAFC